MENKNMRMENKDMRMQKDMMEKGVMMMDKMCLTLDKLTVDKMVMMDKRISITPYLQPPRQFMISTNTTVEHLERLIRNEFMVSLSLNEDERRGEKG